MSRSFSIIIVLCMAVYGSLFFAQEHLSSTQANSLTPAIPTNILRIAGNTYLKQFIAEILFIKTAVYYGGLKKEATPENLTIMAEHYKAMSQLHPLMIDIYYRAESALAHRGNEHVSMANSILETGRAAMPHEVAPPFFEGFNYLNYLDNPLQAAKILKVASEIPNAPQWIGHLASILMAGEGNIRSGLVLLQGMLASSQNERVKKRYREDIQAFKKALLVQQALDNYRHNHKKPVASLKGLVPNYLSSLPTWGNKFYLNYNAPKLSLLRRSK